MRAGEWALAVLVDAHEHAGAQVQPVLQMRTVFQARECALEQAEVRQTSAVREVVRVRHGALERAEAVLEAHGVREVVRECARERAGADAL